MKAIKLVLLSVLTVACLTGCGTANKKAEVISTPTPKATTQATSKPDGNAANDAKNMGDAAGNAVGDIGNAAGNVAKDAGNAVGDAAKGVGDAAKDITNP